MILRAPLDFCTSLRKNSRNVLTVDTKKTFAFVLLKFFLFLKLNLKVVSRMGGEGGP